MYAGLHITLVVPDCVAGRHNDCHRLTASQLFFRRMVQVKYRINSNIDPLNSHSIHANGILLPTTRIHYYYSDDLLAITCLVAYNKHM